MSDERPTRRSRRTAKSAPRRARRAIPALLVAGLSLALIVPGAQMASAGLASFQAGAFLAEWRKQEQAPSPRAAEVAIAAAERAVRQYPVANGQYLQQLGRALAASRAHEPYGDPFAQPTRAAALEALRQSTRVRPAWPATWADLAKVKLQQNEVDGELFAALEHALYLGPWRIDVTQPVAEIGLAAWPSLPVPQRLFTLQAAIRTVEYGHANTRRLYAVAEQAGRADLLCATLSADLKARRKLCQ